MADRNLFQDANERPRQSTAANLSITWAGGEASAEIPPTTPEKTKDIRNRVGDLAELDKRDITAQKMLLRVAQGVSSSSSKYLVQTPLPLRDQLLRRLNDLTGEKFKKVALTGEADRFVEKPDGPPTLTEAGSDKTSPIMHAVPAG